MIREHFRDGSDFGVHITYALPDKEYGTAGVVGFAREHLDTTFMIVSGDLVTDFDFEEIIAFHRQKRSQLTITLIPVEEPLQFGVVITAKNQTTAKQELSDVVRVLGLRRGSFFILTHSVKGRVMRLFMEEATGHEVSYLDGIKILFASHE